MFLPPIPRPSHIRNLYIISPTTIDDGHLLLLRRWAVAIRLTLVKTQAISVPVRPIPITLKTAIDARVRFQRTVVHHHQEDPGTWTDHLDGLGTGTDVVHHRRGGLVIWKVGFGLHRQVHHRHLRTAIFTKTGPGRYLVQCKNARLTVSERAFCWRRGFHPVFGQFRLSQAIV